MVKNKEKDPIEMIDLQAEATKRKKPTQHEIETQILSDDD